MDHISASQLDMYLRCSAQYKFRYVDGIILPPKSSLTRGRAVHKGQQHNYTQKIETREDLPLEEIRQVTAAAFEAEQDKTEFDGDEDPGKVKDEAVTLASLYHTIIAPTVQPVLVENRVTVPIGDIYLLGFLDLVDGQGYIRDTKTAEKSPNQGQADKSLQLTCYVMALLNVTGELAPGVKLDYLVNTKTPKVVTLESKRTMADIDRLIRILEMVIRGIRSGFFVPNPGNMLCSEKNCGYWELCHSEY